MNNTLFQRLLPVVQRVRFRRTMIALAAVWFIFALIVAGLIWLNQTGRLDVTNWWLPLTLLATFTSLIAAFSAQTSRKDFERVVHDLEHQFPDLDTGLLTAAEQRAEPGKPLGFLQQDVIRQAVNHSFLNDWRLLIPGWQLFAAPIAGFVGLIALSAALLLMTWNTRPIEIDPTYQFSEVAVQNVNYEVAVEPGSTEVERNKSLLVLARFADAIPPESVLIVADQDGNETRLPMNKSLDDPVFGARISSVAQPVKYWIEFAEQQTEVFDVSVFDYPELVRADATLQFPEYTKLDQKVVQDVRRLSAVEGTGVELSFYVNKDLAEAKLLPAGKQDLSASEPILLQRNPIDPRLWNASLELLESGKFEVKLTDTEGRENRIPPSLILNVLKNQPPDLKLKAPRRDVQVSAIEELELAVSAWDDFGLNSLGLSYEIPGKQQHELVLLENAEAKKHHDVDYLLEFERLDAEPDQLLSYYFWAEDIGSDGQPRRVQSDMYFAEVRHFEEIFRQGQAPAGGEQQGQQQQQGQNGQNAQQAQQLAELQKQIINATWTLIRRETKSSLTKEFASDTQLLLESQRAALQQLEEGLSEVEDATSRSYVEQVASYMNEAIVHLAEAKTTADTEPLETALNSEKAAYQGLLKLRAREHEVIRQQRQQGQQGQQSGSRQQQQMEQLNLKEDENRYEQERTATEQQATEAGEDRQVLNRLRELSRRQEDLNDRIKELQSALEKAETKAEKEEIENRLKSLREQQEQLLRDTDELLERMQEPENQQRMSDEAQQLEQARENIRQASEALEQGKTSQAAADGTRAQRELEELRDEFQNRSAGQFTEQMRQLRNQAQDLEKEQHSISEELNQIQTGNAPATPDEAPSLRAEQQTPDIAEKLEKQQQGVEEIRRRMRETIEEAETYEPLLAEDLYETYRKSERSRPDQSLESARESFERGWTDDAKVEELKARKGITEMREGIERAAESVLGDETEALRIAEETLRGLNNRLQDELAMAQGQNPGERSDQNPNENRQPGENAGQQTPGQDGQPGDRQNQNDQAQQRQNGQGQGQPEEQPGDGQPSDPNQPGQGQGQPQDGQNQQGQQGQNQQGQQGQNQGGQQGQNQGGQQGQQQQGQGGGGQNQNDQPRDQQGRGQNEPRELQRLDQPPDGQPQPGRDQPGRDRQAGDPTGRDFRGGFDTSTRGGNLRTMERIFGEDFRDFSDRLRDVEEMIADPELRSEAARIREEARQIRIEQKRHAAEPNWDLVKMKVSKPLVELQDRVAEELLRRTSNDAMVPLDRDPVPTEYQDAVRKYYERIGRGQ